MLVPVSDIWDEFVACERSGGAGEESIAVEAERRASNPVLYDCALAVWEFDRPEVVASALSGGRLDVDGPTPRSSQTLLFMAISKRRIRTVRLLVEAGADLRRTESDRSYLFWSAFCDTHPAIAELLLSRGWAVGLRPSEDDVEVAGRRARRELHDLFQRWRDGPQELRHSSATDGEDRKAYAPAAGDRVRIVGGPWGGYEGVIEAADDPASVMVRVNILASVGAPLVTLAASDLEPAAS